MNPLKSLEEILDDTEGTMGIVCEIVGMIAAYHPRLSVSISKW